jgi:hypothetical protein
MPYTGFAVGMTSTNRRFEACSHGKIILTSQVQPSRLTEMRTGVMPESLAAWISSTIAAVNCD